MKVSIITIGDEILIGQIIDTNSSWLGKELSKLGLEVECTISIADKKDQIVGSIKPALEQSELVIITGGLGPTKDDVTKTALAELMDTEMYFDEELYSYIKSYFLKVGFTLTESHRRQCNMPKGVQLLENKMGTAPGMLFEKDDKLILSLPGVPYEMKWIFEHSFKKLFLSRQPRLQHIDHRTIRTIGMGETRIEAKVSNILERLPDNISASYLPGLGQVKLRLTSRSYEDQKETLDNFADEISQELGNLVYGYENTSFEEAIRDTFLKHNCSLSIAESCTGGHIAYRIISAEGASKFFNGSIVAYSNEVKKKQLKVKESTLENHGAVSEETVLEMLNGLFEVMNSDVGIAVTGIAGPGGGTTEKPVGTIWLAWGSKQKQHTTKLQLGKDRIKNIEYTSIVALNRLRLFLINDN